MTAAYKKRAKGVWNRDKGLSNSKERILSNQLEKEASVADSAFVEDLILRNECNEEFNRYLLGEWEEQVPEPFKKKKTNDKYITRLLSSLRYVHKFAQNHAGGSVESLRLQDNKSDWWNEIRQEYYQQYKKQIPELQKLLERDDLPSKLRRQMIEVLALFNIKI